MTLSTSLGLPKKLIRIRDNPHVAVAYHAREHSSLDRDQYVLVQGRASFDPTPDRAWLDSITPEWERFLGPRHTGMLGRSLEVYYYERVAITIEVERILSWPTADCAGEPEVFGAARPPDPPALAEPAEARARRRASRPRGCAPGRASFRTRCSAGSAPTGCRRSSPSRSPAPTTRRSSSRRPPPVSRPEVAAPGSPRTPSSRG